MTRASARSLEWWIAAIRLVAVPFAILQVALSTGYGGHDRLTAWAITGCFAAGAVALFAAARAGRGAPLPLVALAFDFAVVSAYVVLFAFAFGTPTQELLLLAVIEGAVRAGLAGGVVVALATVPVAAWFESRRAHIFHVRFRPDYVTFQAGASLIVALIIGWLVARLDAERERSRREAADAERLRDELGRRADLLEAANRCARTLGASLDLDDAFGAFIREVRGLVPFHRVAIVVDEDGEARVLATAGAGADEVMPPGSRQSLEGNLLREVVETGRTAVRGDVADVRYAEEAELLALGIRSRVLAPLLVGARAIGVISLSRTEPDSFADHEVELVTLLGRLVGAAVQNMRAFEGERRTVEELRRLSAMRADFVSLVSHELRSPMAAVIGAARTLQLRWRELQPVQREAFLALIADETSRLAALVGDVLDTSRIDAGTFSYRFGDVDAASLVRETVAAAGLGQDEVPVVAVLPSQLPPLRADPERLRQVLTNLIENAVKYSPAGVAVEVAARAYDGKVAVTVADRGPGIARADQRLIFEKFGRVGGGAQKPGTGLGLYIARSIAEAHGGSLEVDSRPGEGATFTLTVPVAA